MLDRYSVEKLIDAHGANALKSAAQDRLAGAAAAEGGRVRRPWPIAAKLRELAASGLSLAAVAEQRVRGGGIG